MTGQTNRALVPSAVECVPYEGNGPPRVTLGWPVLFLLVAGCSADIPEGRFACENDRDCPPDMGCNGSDHLCWYFSFADDASVVSDASVADAGTVDSGRDSSVELDGGTDGGAPPDAGSSYTVTAGPDSPGSVTCNLDGLWERGGTMAGLATTNNTGGGVVMDGMPMSSCLTIDIGEPTPLSNVLVSMRGSGTGAVCGLSCASACTTALPTWALATSLDGTEFRIRSYGGPFWSDLMDVNVSLSSIVARYIVICRGNQTHEGGMLEVDYVEWSST